jgi:hypothetical protein
MALPVILEVIGQVPGPVAAGQIASVAERTGVSAMYFEPDTATPARCAVTAALAATETLSVGAWLSSKVVSVAAGELAVLDHISAGRTFGIASDVSQAEAVEAFLIDRRIAVQALLPVLVRGSSSLECLRSARTAFVLVSLSVEELLRPSSQLSDAIEQVR